MAREGRWRCTSGRPGWSYDHWEEVLYPPGTAGAGPARALRAAFATVELNTSFYRWPRDATFAGWRRRLPPGFLLSVKAPRGLTHGKRLYAPEAWVERIARGWHELGDRRAVLLVQLPPELARDDARLDYFLRRLPPGCGTAWSCATPAGSRTGSSPCWSATAPPTAS